MGNFRKHVRSFDAYKWIEPLPCCALTLADCDSGESLSPSPQGPFTRSHPNRPPHGGFRAADGAIGAWARAMRPAAAARFLPSGGSRLCARTGLETSEPIVCSAESRIFRSESRILSAGAGRESAGARGESSLGAVQTAQAADQRAQALRDFTQWTIGSDV
jgi:hypothetical protein